MRVLALFVVALFTVPWILDLVLPAPSGDLTSFLIAFVPTVWTPTMIAVVFLLAGGGVAALRQELKARFRYHHGASRWLALAVVLPIVAVAAAVVSARAAGDAAPFTPASGVPLMIGLQIITGAVGEELGWRGYLLPRLRTLAGVTPSFWIMGTLWSLWHVPAFFDPSLPHYTMPMWLVLLTVAFFGVFMGFVFNRAGESVLATMAAHLTLNIMLGLGGAALSSPMFWAVQAAVFGVAAVGITIASRVNRQQLPRLTDDMAAAKAAG
jgi:uncharacterized protein